MVDILQAIFSYSYNHAFSCMEIVVFRFNFQWNVFLVICYQYAITGSDKNLALNGDKPLSEPMMTQCNYAYMRHSASMSWLGELQR